MSTEAPLFTAADGVTLAGLGLGLWWSLGGPAWAGLGSLVADELDGRLARALGETSAHGELLDWGTDLLLTPAALGRLAAELDVTRPAAAVATTAPLLLWVQAHLRARGLRPSVGSLRALLMLAAMAARKDGR